MDQASTVAVPLLHLVAVLLAFVVVFTIRELFGIRHHRMDLDHSERQAWSQQRAAFVQQATPSNGMERTGDGSGQARVHPRNRPPA